MKMFLKRAANITLLWVWIDIKFNFFFFNASSIETVCVANSHTMSSLMFVLTFLLLLQNTDNKVTHTKCLVHCWKYNTEANYNHSIQCYLIYEIMQLSFSQVFYNMVCMYQIKRIKKILSGSTTKTAFLFLSLFYCLFYEHEFWPCSEFFYFF